MGCAKLKYYPEEYDTLELVKSAYRVESVVQGFMSVDPLKDDYPYYTSYQYAGNKPITYIDLDGLEEAKAEPRKRSVPTPPKLQTDIIQFIVNERPDFVDRFAEKGSQGGQLLKDARQALDEHNDRLVDEFREQVLSDFFISKTIDGTFKFDKFNAHDFFTEEAYSGNIPFNTIVSEVNNAQRFAESEILSNPELDKFVFNSQKAKADARKEAEIRKNELEELRRLELLRQSKEQGFFGVVGQVLEYLGDGVEVLGIVLVGTIVFAEVGGVLVGVGKVTSAAGTALQIYDDYQRLDEDLAFENAKLRVAVFAVGELTSIPLRGAVKNGIIEPAMRATVEIDVKVKQKAVENVFIKQ